MEENQLALLFNISDAKSLSQNKFNTKLKQYVVAIATRILDILGGFVGCMFIIPIMVAVVINHIKEKDFGPVFFVQQRIGKNGKLFKMYKFRTMVKDADKKLDELLEKDEAARKEYQKYKKLKNDPRVTKFGEFLRQTSLDEFPQFLNVLKGEMTLVGPRPYLPREKEDMGEYYEYIVKMKPGVTGPWQVAGRNNLEFEERLEIDREYCDRRGNRRDIKIILKTLMKVVKKEGAI